MSEREPKTIPNIDYLGRSYDVVTMDPLNLGATSKNQNVMDITSKRAIPFIPATDLTSCPPE